MNKKEKTLDKRREFYIPHIKRDGNIIDDEIVRESPIIKKTASSKIVPPAPSKPLVSYAESVGYRESPKRYDNLRPKKDLDEEIVNEMVEEPISDESIGYYDRGVIVEDDPVEVMYDSEPASYVNLYPSVEEVYGGSKNTNSFAKESINKNNDEGNINSKLEESFRQFEEAKKAKEHSFYNPYKKQ